MDQSSLLDGRTIKPLSTASPSSSRSDFIDDAPPPNRKGPLPRNTHSSFILALVRCRDSDLIAQEGLLQLRVMAVCAFCLHALTLFLQFYISSLMFMYVVERREDPFESNLQARDALLQKAIATNTRLNTTDPESATTLKLCWDDHSVNHSMAFILFVYFAKVSIDIKEAVFSTYMGFKIPTTDVGEVVTRSAGSDEVLITGLTTYLRFINFFFVNLPRVIVCLFIAYVGAKFLQYASSIGVLLMKSVGLAFIANISVMLHEALTPTGLKNILTHAAYHYHSDQVAGRWMIWSTLITLIQTVLCASCALFMAKFAFYDVQHFRQLCNTYETMFKDSPEYQIIWKTGGANHSHVGYDIFGWNFRA